MYRVGRVEKQTDGARKFMRQKRKRKGERGGGSVHNPPCNLATASFLFFFCGVLSSCSNKNCSGGLTRPSLEYFPQIKAKRRSWWGGEINYFSAGRQHQT